MEILAKNMKKCRIENKLTQQEIADKLNIHQATYAGYESGKHKPEPETIVKIADIFKVSTDYLLGRYNK
jgi:Predicted transcriptional regulators